MEQEAAHGAKLGVSETPPADAFDAFFRQEYGRLVQTMWLVTGNHADAEDIAQDAMARALHRWGSVSSARDPAAYVYRIALNLNRRRFRSPLRVVPTSSPERAHEDHAEAVAARADLWRAMGSLPTNQREALVLVEWHGMTTEEAGEVLNVKPVSVRVRLHRARQRLGQELGVRHE